jgi:inner membrane protein
MNYHTHTLFGITIAAAAVKIATIFSLTKLSFLPQGAIVNLGLIDFYIAAVLGALLPDIDHANSRAGRKLWFISKPLKLFGVKHRGITHSLLGLILISLLGKHLVNLGWINLNIWSGLIVGYISHLLSDMLNAQGIPLFYPNDKRFKFHLNITTNSWQEHLLFFLIFTLASVVLLTEIGYINFNLNNLPNLFKLN